MSSLKHALGEEFINNLFKCKLPRYITPRFVPNQCTEFVHIDGKRIQIPGGGGGGHSPIKITGVLAGNFEKNP